MFQITQKEYLEQIAENPSAYLITVDSRIRIAKSYLDLLSRLREAVGEIEKQSVGYEKYPYGEALSDALGIIETYVPEAFEAKG